MRDSLSRSIYVLTIWQEREASSDQPAVWRYSLEDARTGERRAFAILEQMVAFLVAFLREQTGDRSEESPAARCGDDAVS